MEKVNGIMKSFDDMDRYEQAIAKELYNQFPDVYDIEQARKKVEEYYDVMERIGWHWSPKDWAKRLHGQIQKDIQPNQWMKDTIKLEQMPNRPGEKAND